jgi:hypothetical protein
MKHTVSLSGDMTTGDSPHLNMTCNAHANGHFVNQHGTAYYVASYATNCAAYRASVGHAAEMGCTT